MKNKRVFQIKKMFDIIVACNKDFGIGINGHMAWYCPEELKLFRNKTRNSVLIMGRKTVANLPNLKNRIILCVSKSCFSTVENALYYAEQNYAGKKIFVAGGGQIYKYCVENLLDKIDKLHISFMETHTECDVFLEINMENWIIEEENKYENFSHHVMIYRPYGEVKYLQLLSEVYNTGTEREGRNGKTRSKFSRNLSFDLQDGFPLITTKKMFIRGIIEELLFFIRGHTDSKLLENKGVNIWKGNSNRAFLDSINMPKRKEGILGPLYGYQWRYFNAKYNEELGVPIETGIDQMKLVVNTILNDPHSRRILMTDFNPAQASSGVLYPCHSIVLQFYVDKENLDMFCYNRSQDLFLGTPFNIASSALLLILIAMLTKLRPRYLHITLGDVHIYEEHLSAVQEQMSRQPYKFPTIKINKTLLCVEDIENLKAEDVTVCNYQCHSPIKVCMVA